MGGSYVSAAGSASGTAALDSFPALYFAILSFCQVFDFATNRVKFLGLYKNPAIVRALAVAVVAISIGAFAMYSPLAYGNPWTKSACEKSKLLTSWDFDCNTFHPSLSQYGAGMGGATQNVVPTMAAMPINAKKPASAQQVNSVGQQAPPAGQIHREISREEKVEYRDQDGNLLNDEQVAALKGKVSFSTKYETRTRLVDANGQEVAPSGEAAVAPPHPDVHGAEPETVGGDSEVRSEKNTPASEDVASDLKKESIAEEVAEKESSAAVPEAEPAAET